MQKLKLLAAMLLFCAGLSCQNSYKDRDETIVRKQLKIYMVDGRSKIISVDVPSYTTFDINSSIGNYRLSYWTYEMNGLVKVEQIIKNGVIDYEILK